MVTCHYCAEFMGSKVIETKTIGKKKYVVKKCQETGREIESSTERCERFKPVNVFHCSRNQYRISIPCCIRRKEYVTMKHKKRAFYMRCLACKQVKTIEKIADEFGLQPPAVKKLRRRKPSHNLRRRNSAPVKSLRRRKIEPVKKLRRRQKPQKLRRRK